MLTPEVQQILDDAIQHHREGRLVEAEAGFRKILELEPRHPEALYYLGWIAYQAGRIEDAVDLMRQAIEGKPESAGYQNNLGNALCDLGRFEEATVAYRRAIESEPDLVEAHNNLATALSELNRNDEAIVAFQRTIQLRPDLVEAHINMGTALSTVGRMDEAAAAIRKAIELKPDFHEAHSSLGIILRELDLPDEAVASCRRAIEIKPDFADGFNSLGAALRKQGRLDEAVAAHRRAIELKPRFADALSNLGNVLKDQGRLDEALAAHREAIELKPDFPDAKLNCSLVLLVKGDYERGWPLYEARWELTKGPKRLFPKPRWNGEPLKGRRVLLHAEQGFGDAIQCVRYASRIAEQGGSVIVECRQPLVKLFRRAKGVGEVVVTGEAPPPFDFHLPMLSLPLVMGTTLENIPREIPYLSADPGRCEAWRARVGTGRSRLRVGLAWAGNPKHRGDRFRSIGLRHLFPLFQLEGIEFFSLQREQGSEEIRKFPWAEGIVDHTASLADFSETAAMLAQLDLVISVDTAVLHLAGALGIPAWALLGFAPDWRWLLGRTDSPWYPGMRLFRQQRFMEWESVIAEVRDQLGMLVESRK